FYAYSNFCLHQGGPACEGLTIAKVEERLLPDKTSQGLYFSDSEMHFVCPWHGYEYDMKTGECVSDRKLNLRQSKGVETGDDVYVVTEGGNDRAARGSAGGSGGEESAGTVGKQDRERRHRLGGGEAPRRRTRARACERAARRPQHGGVAGADGGGV